MFREETVGKKYILTSIRGLILDHDGIIWDSERDRSISEGIGFWFFPVFCEFPSPS
jgi:hypothetical protein